MVKINMTKVLKQTIDIRNEYDVYCPRARGAYLEDAPETIFTEPGWVLEPKEDGLRVSDQLLTGRGYFVGRNRQDFLKGVARAKEFRHLGSRNPFLEDYTVAGIAGTLLDGELTETYKGATKKQIKLGNYFPYYPDEDSQNMVPLVYDKYTETRIANGEDVGYIIWDCYFWKGSDIRDRPMRMRREAAKFAIDKLKLKNEKFRLIKQYPCTPENLQWLFDQGWEGAVAKNLEHPVPLQITHTHWWKLKGDEARTIDAFVIGVTEGTSGGSGVRDVKPQPDGTAASFTIGMYRKGKIVEVGKVKHLPDDVHLKGFHNFGDYNKRVMEVIVSGFDGKRFRWPRMKQWRPDKDPKHCQYDEQVGKESK